MREVTPLVDRPPYGDWCRIFYLECEEAKDLDWKGAGFALCNADDVERVRARLEEVTAQTNRRFTELMKTAQPRAVADQLIILESISAASVDGDRYRIVWPR